MYSCLLNACRTLVLAVMLWPGTAAASPTPSQSFRAAYPFHVQGIALSTVGDRRTLIVAEPPPHVTLFGLRQHLPAGSSAPILHRQKIGIDGWVADLEIKLPKMTDLQLSELISNLHIYLFDTSYKAELLPWVPTKRNFYGSDLSIQVAPNELNAWLLEKVTIFSPLDGAEGLPFSTLLSGGEPGVYVSEDIGLVLWLLPRNRPIDQYLAAARYFTLDSDLIVGAIASDERIAILGRMRAVPYSVMPPLRVETIRLLASVTEAQLAQSYERTTLFGGKLADGLDWAPIYLSRQLIDTELGSLLNITDQILKGFSQAGTVSYQNFNYPIPPRWPFRQPIIKEAEAKQIVYNWNTRGLGHLVSLGRHELLAIKDTGTLPVTYVPDGRESGGASMAKFEAQAYSYFSDLRDPNLARVVQYTALFQIFRNFQVRASASSSGARRDHATACLVDQATKLLRRIADTDERSLKSAIEQYMARRRTLGIDKDRDDIDDRGAMHMVLAIGSLKIMKQQAGVGAVDQMAAYLAAPKAATRDFDEQQRKVLSLLLQIPDALHAFADMGMVHRACTSIATAHAQGWIHTPVWVASRPREGVRRVNLGDGKIAISVLTGGHDLAARVSRHVGLRDSTLFEHFPRMAQAPRLPRVALFQRTPEVRPSWSAQWKGVKSGWGVRQRSLSADEASLIEPLIEAQIDNAMVIERTTEGAIRLLAPGRAQAVYASTLPDAVDAFGLLSTHASRGGKQARVVMQGFSEIEAAGFLHNCELRFSGQRPLTVRSATANTQQAARVLSTSFDFSQARITSSRAISVEGKRCVEVTVEVPPMGRWQRFSLMVRMFFQTISGRPGAMLAKATLVLEQALQKVLRKGGGSYEPLDLREELIKELHLRMPEAAGSIELEIKQEGAGLIIGIRLVDHAQTSDNAA